jgi:hypothetical protein
MGWPTTSPMAKMCGTLVRICTSTGMKPRSSPPRRPCRRRSSCRWACGPPPAAPGRRGLRSACHPGLRIGRGCRRPWPRRATVLVFSMMLSKRGAFIFCQTLTRSRSAPCIRPSSISTTSSRAPSVEYTVPISRPMMPPPTTSMRLGLAQFQRAGAVDDARVVGQERQPHRLRAGGDDALLELDGLRLAGLAWPSPVVSSRWCGSAKLP